MTNPNAKLIEDYADLGVSCGYIGNLERWGDDRSFRVFTKLSSKAYASSPDISINVGLVDGKPVYDTPAVRSRLDMIRERVKLGTLHHIIHS